MSLRANLELKSPRPVLGAPLELRFTVTNDSEQPVTVPSPDVGSPPAELHWPASTDAYRASVLMSYGVLELILETAGGEPVASRGLASWVTPLLGKRHLDPGESLVLDLDLAELFAIGSTGLYNLYAGYGEPANQATGTIDLAIGERPGT